MGCVCSRRAREDDTDGLSFADYVVGSKMVEKGYDSGELGFVVKPGVSKVPETSSLLGRAGIYGMDKAVEVLDTLGSSMSNLNPNSGFLSGVAARGYKISILAFEVANTIAKGANLMQSLSEENIQFLRKEILPSEGVQQLVSTDNKELLTIAANDKREEFRVFSTEVVRFGDLCKDPEWHNLARYFEKLDSDPTPKEKLKEAEATLQQLINLAQHTSELYHEFNALDRLEQDMKRKLREEESVPASRRGETITILHTELKHQRKLVKNLKKKSLWFRNLEEVVEKLVDVVVFLHRQILEAFDLCAFDPVEGTPVPSPQKLGVSGLALHYANVINQIDNIVSRPMALLPNTRDTLYHGLPLGVKAALRSRLLSFHVDELTVPLIKAEMQKILHWIFPMAEHTIKTHQGFGWVGEWANMGTEANRKPGQLSSAFRIQTLYHADKEKTEEYILQLVVWLHHLVDQVKNKGYGFNPSKPAHYVQRKSLSSSPDNRRGAASTNKIAIMQLSWQDRQMLESVSYKRLVLVRSKSHGFVNSKDKRYQRTLSFSKSTGSSPARELSKTLDFQFRGRNVLHVIDGVDTLDPFDGAYS